MSLDDVRDELDEYIFKIAELLGEHEEHIHKLRKSMEEMDTELDSVDDLQDDLDNCLQKYSDILKQMSNSNTFARKYIAEHTAFSVFKEDQMEIYEGTKVAPDILEDAYIAGYMYAINDMISKLRYDILY